MLRKILFFAILLTSVLSTAVAQQGYRKLSTEQLQVLVPSSTRNVISLAGNWERSIDGETWGAVYLPYSEFETERVTYRRTIRIDAAVAKNYTWHFECLGINDAVEIYVNDRFISRFFGGLTPFRVRIPDGMIAGGTNTLKFIVVGANEGMAKIKDRHLFANETYNGVVRELLLVGTPHIWVNDVDVKTAVNETFSNAQVNAIVRISSGEFEKMLAEIPDSLAGGAQQQKASVTIEATLLRKGTGETVATANPQLVRIERERTVPVNFSLNVANPALWSPENPQLYELAIKISKGGQLIDNYAATVGIRDVRTGTFNGQTGILLNGQFFEIKGVEYVEELEGARGTLSANKIEQDVQLLKTLGANIVRVRYAAPHPYFVHLCDKNGIFVLIDIPVYDLPASIIGSKDMIVRMGNIAKNMITAYNSHPSIIGWNISDGLQEGSPYSDRYFAEITKTLRANSTKLIGKTVRAGANTININGIDLLSIRFDKLLRNNVKVIDELNRVRQIAKDKPIIANFGTFVQPNNLNGYADPLSVEAQAQYIAENFRAAHNSKIAGSIVWSFNDYLLNRPMLATNANNQYVATSGLTGRNRQPRLSFSMLQALFNDEKEPLLHAGTYTSETPLVFIATGIILGIILLVINRSRRFREYMSRALFRPYNFYADIRDQRILSQFQTYLLGAITATVIGLVLASTFYFLRMNYEMDYILMNLIPARGLRELLNSIIWHPGLSLLTFSMLAMIGLFIIALIIRIGAAFVRGRIFMSDAITIAVWSSLPFLFLLPLGIALFKLLSVTNSVFWLFIVLAVLVIWVLYRILKSTAVVFDVPPQRVYLIGSAIIILLIIGTGMVLDTQYGMMAYMQYFMNVLRG
ncbi:MAG TPA: glycoside hydrolase family 2 TIM barrel-domain containing protein [Patescibacteria group bacterium]|nr:glycoside hydrolase family 2 TIM barrel-domain containing protein [Patescibacteria group bacterium]